MIQARARHILVNDHRFCLDLKRQLESGKPFELLARQFSECPTARQDGDLGLFCPGQMGDAIDATVFNGQPGWIYGPVQTDRGFHMIQVLALEESRDAAAGSE